MKMDDNNVIYLSGAKEKSAEVKRAVRMELLDYKHRVDHKLLDIRYYTSLVSTFVEGGIGILFGVVGGAFSIGLGIGQKDTTTIICGAIMLLFCSAFAVGNLIAARKYGKKAKSLSHNMIFYPLSTLYTDKEREEFQNKE